LLLPCGPGPDTEAASKPTAKWLEAVAAAQCIPEVVEAVRRNANRLGVVEPAVRLLLRLCVGKDSDTDRRRAFAVDADAAPILLEVTDTLGDAVTKLCFCFCFAQGGLERGRICGGGGDFCDEEGQVMPLPTPALRELQERLCVATQVLNANEMYEKCDRFFDPAALAREGREGASQREARRGGAPLALDTKRTVFVATLAVLELCSGGSSKVADERRIKLIGVIADEICDLLSSNRSVARRLVTPLRGFGRVPCRAFLFVFTLAHSSCFLLSLCLFTSF
jgi:hypothetical protein